MSADQSIKVALIGNPNSGKSSLFNLLTGLSQKVSNYPGVTVDKKAGTLQLSTGEKVTLIDFPGIYSLYPNSTDERIVVETLSNPNDPNYPDAIIYVAASQELEKHFLLASQIRQLDIPMLVCLTMTDLKEKDGIKYDTDELSTHLNTNVVEVSSLKGINIDGLKYNLIDLIRKSGSPSYKKAYQLTAIEQKIADTIGSITGFDNSYRNLLIGHHRNWLKHLTEEQREQIDAIPEAQAWNSTRAQIEETLSRYNVFTKAIEKATIHTKLNPVTTTERIDNIITHRFLGPLIFFAIMFFVFQAIYAWAETPMDWIETAFASLGTLVRQSLPVGWFTDLLIDGVIAGLGGIIVFVPQIAILFFLISALEEVGYMSRAVFMFDALMQRFGLNGRSIVALISSGACAIPAIMSTRTIANWKERLITILVSPLISCSARIPVYTVLIGFVVPPREVLGIFNLQGIAFMGLYILGIVAALVSAWVFKKMLRSDERSFLMIELPQYKQPMLKNVLLTVKDKVGSFIVEAGKVILMISIVLWFLASYGPPEDMANAVVTATEAAQAQQMDEGQTEDMIASAKLEASYAGHLGKLMEPVIQPLGFDWKMGIALITSFAAREVFVGTMATIYSVGSTDDELTIRERLAEERNPLTGGPRYDVPTALSLLLFYVFAMQCMSTLAVTKKETNSWKWPMVQFTFMTVLAYVSSLLSYQLLA